jgi:hypothetical protein
LHLRHLFTRAAGVAAIVFAALLVASCGGDGNAAEPEPTTTTRRPTTTTSTTTTTIPPTLSQITGLPVDDDAVLERPVIAVKIGSDRAAQPQHGLDVADLVVEELVEGGISRFLAVFQSTESDPVGPVRSARTSEIELLPLFGRPIFAHSGGNAGTIRALANANTSVAAGHNSGFGNLYVRDRSRSAPFNLFVDTSVLRAAAAETAAAPGQLFHFLGDDDEVSPHALPVVGVDISFGSTRTRWVWDAEREGFLRWQDGREHLDPQNFQLVFPNLIVLFTPYGTSPADPGSPEAITVGSGEAWVLSHGIVTPGSWERTSADAPYVLRDADGNDIRMTPGRIWLSLPRQGRGEVTFLDADPR